MERARRTRTEEETALEDVCRAAGAKLTHQRIAILRELRRAEDHPTAEMLRQRLRRRLPRLSLDTVYRALEMLEGRGMIVRLEDTKKRGRFDGGPQPHHHLLCAECGAIVDFAWPGVDDEPLPRAAREWGRVLKRQLRLVGVCRKCLSARGKRSPSPTQPARAHPSVLSCGSR